MYKSRICSYHSKCQKMCMGIKESDEKKPSKSKKVPGGHSLSNNAAITASLVVY